MLPHPQSFSHGLKIAAASKRLWRGYKPIRIKLSQNAVD